MDMYTTFHFNQPKELDWFLATVRFGMPSRDCRNLGICRIEVVDEKIDFFSHYGKAMAWFAMKKNGSLEFIFLRNSLTPGTKAHHFKNNAFVVEEEYVIPEKVASKLKQSRLVIQPGVYAVTESPTYFTVQLKVCSLITE